MPVDVAPRTRLTIRCFGKAKKTGTFHYEFHLYAIEPKGIRAFQLTIQGEARAAQEQTANLRGHPAHRPRDVALR